MTWVRLDPEFAQHPKIVQAGPLASWLYVCGLAYANQHLTDGFIPGGAVPLLTSFEGIATHVSEGRLVEAWEPVDVRDLTDRLVQVGMWEVADGGFRIHDFSKYQPARDEVLARRQDTSQRRSDQAKTRPRDRGGRFRRDGNGSPVGDPAVSSASAGPDAGPEAAGGDQSGHRASTPVPNPVLVETSHSTNGGGGPEGGAATLDVEGRLGDTAAHLLRRLGGGRRSWHFLMERELEEVGRLADEFGQSALSRALQQANDDPARIRRPLTWLRTVVPKIAEESTAPRREGVSH